ncbi:high-potential iron-sulfur protein [Thioalkalicoccus limnaeus]|uniref:High-potential iron-sulfur protein n=1 Tax=Thioalkalicoccus limnaeus TaxID=120681 RepID=A0ABV4BHX4_9GAMM
MSDKPICKSRRDAMKMMLGGFAAIPVINLVGLGNVQASDLPPVDPATNPIAIALKYVHDATESERESYNRPGAPANEQTCANCAFDMASEGEWRPCSLFPGMAIHENGWCTSWALKS